MVKPFRWNIAKREQLGALFQDGEYPPPSDEYLDILRSAAAKIVAYADDANLAFIGRSPENFYDYLSGIFVNVDPAPKLHLIQFSLRWAGVDGLKAIEPAKQQGLFDYFVEEGVDSRSISSTAGPLALVDFVAEGGTMKNLIGLMKMQADQEGVDWNVVQKRLRIVGLRVRTHNSPNTWRWQQHQDWLDGIPDSVIKNVSMPASFLYYVGNEQAKTTSSFHPGHWDTAENTRPSASEMQRRALSFAVQLYDIGNSNGERRKLSALIAKTHQMNQRQTRQIVTRLKQS